MSRANTGSIVRPRLGPPGKSMRIKLFLGHLRSLRYENTKSLSITETFRRLTPRFGVGLSRVLFFLGHWATNALLVSRFFRVASQFPPTERRLGTADLSGLINPHRSLEPLRNTRSFRHESHRRAVSVSDENVLRRSSEGYS